MQVVSRPHSMFNYKLNSYKDYLHSAWCGKVFQLQTLSLILHSAHIFHKCPCRWISELSDQISRVDCRADRIAAHKPHFYPQISTRGCNIMTEFFASESNWTVGWSKYLVTAQKWACRCFLWQKWQDMPWCMAQEIQITLRSNTCRQIADFPFSVYLDKNPHELPWHVLVINFNSKHFETFQNAISVNSYVWSWDINKLQLN